MQRSDEIHSSEGQLADPPSRPFQARSYPTTLVADDNEGRAELSSFVNYAADRVKAPEQAAKNEKERDKSPNNTLHHAHHHDDALANLSNIKHVVELDRSVAASSSILSDGGGVNIGIDSTPPPLLVESRAINEELHTTLVSSRRGEAEKRNQTVVVASHAETDVDGSHTENDRQRQAFEPSYMINGDLDTSSSIAFHRISGSLEYAADPNLTNLLQAPDNRFMEKENIIVLVNNNKDRSDFTIKNGNSDTRIPPRDSRVEDKRNGENNGRPSRPSSSSRSSLISSGRESASTAQFVNLLESAPRPRNENRVEKGSQQSSHKASRHRNEPSAPHYLATAPDRMRLGHNDNENEETKEVLGKDKLERRRDGDGGNEGFFSNRTINNLDVDDSNSSKNNRREAANRTTGTHAVSSFNIDDSYKIEKRNEKGGREDWVFSVGSPTPPRQRQHQTTLTIVPDTAAVGFNSPEKFSSDDRDGYKVENKNTKSVRVAVVNGGVDNETDEESEGEDHTERPVADLTEEDMSATKLVERLTAIKKQNQARSVVATSLLPHPNPKETDVSGHTQEGGRRRQGPILAEASSAHGSPLSKQLRKGLSSPPPPGASPYRAPPPLPSATRSPPPGQMSESIQREVVIPTTSPRRVSPSSLESHELLQKEMKTSGALRPQKTYLISSIEEARRGQRGHSPTENEGNNNNNNNNNKVVGPSLYARQLSSKPKTLTETSHQRLHDASAVATHDRPHHEAKNNPHEASAGGYASNEQYRKFLIERIRDRQQKELEAEKLREKYKNNESHGGDSVHPRGLADANSATAKFARQQSSSANSRGIDVTSSPTERRRNPSPQSNSEPPPAPVHSTKAFLRRMQEKEQESKRDLAAKQRQRKEEELAECTFSPRVSRQSSPSSKTRDHSNPSPLLPPPPPNPHETTAVGVFGHFFATSPASKSNEGKNNDDDTNNDFSTSYLRPTVATEVSRVTAEKQRKRIAEAARQRQIEMEVNFNTKTRGRGRKEAEKKETNDRYREKHQQATIVINEHNVYDESTVYDDDESSVVYMSPNNNKTHQREGEYVIPTAAQVQQKETRRRGIPQGAYLLTPREGGDDGRHMVDHFSLQSPQPLPPSPQKNNRGDNQTTPTTCSGLPHLDTTSSTSLKVPSQRRGVRGALGTETAAAAVFGSLTRSQSSSRHKPHTATSLYSSSGARMTIKTTTTMTHTSSKDDHDDASEKFTFRPIIAPTSQNVYKSGARQIEGSLDTFTRLYSRSASFQALNPHFAHSLAQEQAERQEYRKALTEAIGVGAEISSGAGGRAQTVLWGSKGASPIVLASPSPLSAMPTSSNHTQRYPSQASVAAVAGRDSLLVHKDPYILLDKVPPDVSWVESFVLNANQKYPNAPRASHDDQIGHFAEELETLRGALVPSLLTDLEVAESFLAGGGDTRRSKTHPIPHAAAFFPVPFSQAPELTSHLPLSHPTMRLSAHQKKIGKAMLIPPHCMATFLCNVLDSSSPSSESVRSCTNRGDDTNADESKAETLFLTSKKGGGEGRISSHSLTDVKISESGNVFLGMAFASADPDTVVDDAKKSQREGEQPFFDIFALCDGDHFFRNHMRRKADEIAQPSSSSLSCLPSTSTKANAVEFVRSTSHSSFSRSESKHKEIKGGGAVDINNFIRRQEAMQKTRERRLRELVVKLAPTHKPQLSATTHALYAAKSRQEGHKSADADEDSAIRDTSSSLIQKSDEAADRSEAVSPARLGGHASPRMTYSSPQRLGPEFLSQFGRRIDSVPTKDTKTKQPPSPAKKSPQRQKYERNASTRKREEGEGEHVSYFSRGRSLRELSKPRQLPTQHYDEHLTFMPVISEFAHTQATGYGPERLHAEAKLREKRREKMRQEAIEKELKTVATFKPKTNTDVNTQRYANVESLLNQRNLHSDVYQRHVDRRKQVLEARKAVRDCAEDEEDLRECTFKPSINRLPSYITTMSEGYAAMLRTQRE